MGKLFNNGLPVGSGLKIEGEFPADDRLFVEFIADLTDPAVMPYKHDGMEVYVAEALSKYRYNEASDEWVAMLTLTADEFTFIMNGLVRKDERVPFLLHSDSLVDGNVDLTSSPNSNLIFVFSDYEEIVGVRFDTISWYPGQIITIQNQGSYAVKFKENNNLGEIKFINPNKRDFVLDPSQHAIFTYSSSNRVLHAINLPENGRKIIHMQPGEYLMDIIIEINERNDATSDNPYTIYFYNHSKTIDWDRWTQLIPFPEHVYLEFVGDINWWVNVPYYEPRMGFDEGLITSDSIDRLFLGFTFSRANEDGISIKTGLPNFIGAAYFSGLDEVYEIAPTIADLPDFGNGILGIVFCEEDKNLYKKVGDNFVIITQSFENANLMSCNFYAGYLAFANLQSAYLYQANLQSANLHEANLQSANLQQATLQNAYLQQATLQNAYLENANLQSAYLSQANLQSANLYQANLQSVYLYQANLQSANLHEANLQSANLHEANLQSAFLRDIQVNTSTRFQGANLTGAQNLPADMNTKSLFIAKVGANNVDAQTIWIDGTSILD